jgi:hypothetical protein
VLVCRELDEQGENETGVAWMVAKGRAVARKLRRGARAQQQSPAAWASCAVDGRRSGAAASREREREKGELGRYLEK